MQYTVPSSQASSRKNSSHNMLSPSYDDSTESINFCNENQTALEFQYDSETDMEPQTPVLSQVYQPYKTHFL